MHNKCWTCGAEATKGFDIYNQHQIEKAREEYGNNDINVGWVKTSLSPSAWQRVYCEGCFTKAIAERKELSTTLALVKAKIKVEKAIRMLERQGGNVYMYRAAIDRVSEYATASPASFASSHEVLAAIILIHNGYQIKTQYAVAGYRADFYLPELRVLLEIDGYLHKGKKNRDAERDAKILAEMPEGWEMIRIPTEHIERKADRLVTAIKTVLAERAKKTIKKE